MRALNLTAVHIRLIGLCMGALALITFVYLVGFRTLEDTLLSANPMLIVAMVTIQLLGFVAYGVAWYLLILASGNKIRFLNCQGICFASIFASYVTPSGFFLEASRVLLAVKETGMKFGESLATVILNRILYIAAFLASNVAAIIFLLSTGNLYSPMLTRFEILLSPTTILVAAISYVSLRPNHIQPLISRLTSLARPLTRLMGKYEPNLDDIHESISQYNQSFRKIISAKRTVCFSFLANLGDWTCTVMVIWLALIAVHYPQSIWIAIITATIGRLIQFIPIGIPGMIGIYEGAIIGSLSLFSVPFQYAASAAILIRIVTFWFDFPITGLAAYHYGFKLFYRGRTAVGKIDAGYLKP